jgi:hypothetical protein
MLRNQKIGSRQEALRNEEVEYSGEEKIAVEKSS